MDNSPKKKVDENHNDIILTDQQHYKEGLNECGSGMWIH